MCVKYFIWLLMIFSVLVPGGLNCSPSCSSITLNIQLGSRVLLPCTLSKSKKTYEARWSQTSSLLSIRANGSVNFDDPRDGRIIVFPYQFDKGNYSILIHQFQASDMGMYCCQLSQECQRIKIKLFQEHHRGLSFPWYYIAAGVGAFILLVIVFSVIYAFRERCVKRGSDSYYVNSGHNEEQKKAEQRESVENGKVDECEGEYEDLQSDTQEADYENALGIEQDSQYGDTVSEEQNGYYVNAERINCQEQYADSESEHPAEHHVERDISGHHDHKSVYENDEHGPKQKSGFHPKAATAFKEMPNQQPDSKEQYYANHSEIQKSARTGKRKKDKAKYQLKNPLYDQILACNSL